MKVTYLNNWKIPQLLSTSTLSCEKFPMNEIDNNEFFLKTKIKYLQKLLWFLKKKKKNFRKLLILTVEN